MIICTKVKNIILYKIKDITYKIIFFLKKNIILYIMDYYDKIIKLHDLESEIEKLIASGNKSPENRELIASKLNEYEEVNASLKKRLELSIGLDNRTKADALGEQLHNLLAKKDKSKRALIEKLMNEYEDLMRTINEENKIMEKYGLKQKEFRFNARLAYLKEGDNFEQKFRRLNGLPAVGPVVILPSEPVDEDIIEYGGKKKRKTKNRNRKTKRNNKK